MSDLTESDTVVEALSDADFERFRQFFYRRTGIFLADSKRYYADRRIAASIREERASGFNAWFATLRLGTNTGPFQRIVNRMTVNETYFFRERYQFDCLVRSVLPAVIADNRGSKVRILCLPCSSGEEPYSIAMTLLSEWEAIDTVDVEIVGVDIDTGILEDAQNATYAPRSVSHVPPSYLARYFTAVGDGHYCVIDDIKGAVALQVANVCKSETRGLRDFDVVFCRNLLIYFDQLSCRLAAENLFGALRPGGYLFLGHSESMSRISNIFVPVRFVEGIVYQRPKKAR